MKKFKTKRNKQKSIEVVFVLILLFLFALFYYYNKNISYKVINIAEEKLEEISILYIKKDIVPKKVVLNDLLKINMNQDGEITYVDVDMDYARELMVEIVENIQNNIFELEKGNISGFENSNELKSYKGNLYISVPLLLGEEGVLIQQLGPKVPIRLSFYEHALGNVDTTITEYGINNALIKVNLEIELEQKIILPYTEKTYKRTFSLVLGSKIVNGKVPSFYGGTYNKSSSTLEV